MLDTHLQKTKTVLVLRLERTEIVLVRSDLRWELERLLEEPEGEL
jgi:hypothetical protein